MNSRLRKSLTRFFSGLALIFSVANAQSYSFFNPLSLFPDGDIIIDFRLGSPTGTLIDGNTSWNVVVQSAAAEWNSYINTVDFKKYTTAQKAPAPDDGVNQIYWDDTINGVPFGSRTLAVTTRWTLNSVCVEADTVFNLNKFWNSYRGPLKPAASGGTLHEIYRVGVHELGHVLGLGHPDDYGQNVYAVMNSEESDVDDVTADDVAGARALYYGFSPSILAQPTSQTIVVGGSTQFAVQADGIPSPGFQWYWNNSPLPGATSPTLNVSNASEADSGTLRVLVRNSHGSLWSDSVVLRVLAPPHVIVGPANRAVAVGTPVTFSISASGTQPFTYRWYHDGALIPNANSSSYTFVPTSAANEGQYYATVMNDVGTDTSSAAQLTVVFPPSITITNSAIVALEGSTPVLTATVTGTQPITYQWLFKGRALAGANAAQLALPAASKTSAGVYVLEVRNAAGVVRSSPLLVTVVIPPTIIRPPLPRIVQLGKKASFRVTAKGTKPLLYQWYKDGVPIPNATARAFAITAAQSTDAASYSVKVANVGATVETVPVSLTVQ